MEVIDRIERADGRVAERLELAEHEVEMVDVGHACVGSCRLCISDKAWRGGADDEGVIGGLRRDDDVCSLGFEGVDRIVDVPE